MAKRNDDGLLDGIFELAMVLPWWVDGVLAVASYAGLHHFAQPPDVVAAAAAPTTAVVLDVVGPVVRALAGIGQYVVPLVLLAGAVVSVFRRAHRVRLLERSATAHGASVVAAMSWHDFEILTGELFRRRGYVVEETGGSRPDGGVDLVATRTDERVLVQCKHWRTRSVGVSVVRELLGAVTAAGATSGAVVSSGSFTRDAQRFALDHRLELLDGDALRAATGTVMMASISVSALNGGPRALPGVGGRAPRRGLALGGPPPLCPTCSRPMVRRATRRGPKRGHPFWGCPTFPACRGTRDIARV